MADNINVTAGTGKTIAADDVQISGTNPTGLVQFVKLVDGTLDGTEPIHVGGGTQANALRVTVASDSSGVLSVDDNGGALTVDNGGTFAVQSTLQTGANAIGKLTANSGVDIGDVDVLSVAGNVTVVQATATNLKANVTIAAAQTLATLTTITNDVSIDDGGNAITTDWAGTAPPIGAGVEATALRVTVATDSTGTLTVDTTGTSGLEVVQATAADLNCTEASAADIKTSVQIIDDWDAVHASASTTDGPQIMGAAYSTGLPTDVGADADAARICTDRFGRVLAGIQPQLFQATFTSADATSAAPVKAKTASRKMYILSLVVSTDTAMNIQFQDDTGPTVLIEQLYFAANGGAHLTWPADAPLVVNTNEDFDVIASAAGNISVTITGYLAV